MAANPETRWDPEAGAESQATSPDGAKGTRPALRVLFSPEPDVTPEGPSGPGETPWHALPRGAVLARLESNETMGLQEGEASRRLTQAGFNEIPRPVKKRTPWWRSISWGAPGRFRDYF